MTTKLNRARPESPIQRHAFSADIRVILRIRPTSGTTDAMGEFGAGHDAPPFAERQRDRMADKLRRKDRRRFPFIATSPTLYVKNGEECGSSAARYTALPESKRAFRKCERAVIHTGEIRRLKRLTVLRAKAYIGRLGRTAALARWRVRETLTVYTVNHPAMTHGHVGCAGVGGSGSCRG
jgi:hypothetical protein